MVRRRVLYTGRVQGVGFRASARAIAGGFRVTGWVRNEPDGSVRLEVQGDESEARACLGEIADRLGRFISASDETTGRVDPDESRFEIRH